MFALSFLLSAPPQPFRCRRERGTKGRSKNFNIFKCVDQRKNGIDQRKRNAQVIRSWAIWKYCFSCQILSAAANYYKMHLSLFIMHHCENSKMTKERQTGKLTNHSLQNTPTELHCTGCGAYNISSIHRFWNKELK